MAMDNFAENVRDKSPPVTDPEVLAAALSNVGTMSPRLRKLYDDSTAALRAQANEIDRLHDRLRQIGDRAHDASTGPAVPDVLWEIRSMAYDGIGA